MPIKQPNAYQVLLTKSLNDKDFVNEALSLLESSLWEMSLLVLQDWANTKQGFLTQFIPSIAATEVWFNTSNVCREPRVIGFQSVILV